MARLVPENPTFVIGSEREVCERLLRHLGEHDVVLPNVRVTDEAKDHEADVVLLLEGVGVVVAEVKGGSVWLEGDQWHQATAGSSRVIDPVTQARESKYALREYVESDPRWGSNSRVVWAHAVITPYADLSDYPGDRDLPRWALHDRADQLHLGRRIRETAERMSRHQRPPGADDVALIEEILTRRADTSYDVNAEAAEREATADLATEQQAAILRVTRLLHRIEVRGGAGTGKTMLALQQARELTLGVPGRQPQRTALICYSIGLAEHLRREVETWPRKHRPAYVGTFAALGQGWGAPDGDRTQSNFWEHELPEIMAGLAADLSHGHRFDSIVVDESQDFADSWWTPLLACLREPDSGGLYVFSDENQRIFARFGRPPVDLLPLVLDHNLRNTREIHDSFAPLAPSRMYAKGGSGPTVRFVPASIEDAAEVADDEVVRLLDDKGWEEGRVALITTGTRHDTQRDQQEKLGQEGYWATYFEGEEVFYGHVLGCKGLERSAVVLCVNEDGSRDRARERLYVGMSRATDLLVVVGDPEVVRAIGGPAVATRLGIPG